MPVSVSVIVPTCERPQLLGRALRSVAAQEFMDFEVVVVNDGRTDVQELVEESLKDKRFKYLSTSGFSGPSASRNLGLRAAEGEFIAYLDDDDLYGPNHLVNLYQGATSNPGAVVYSDFKKANIKYAAGKPVESGREKVSLCEFSRQQWAFDNHVPNLAVLHPKQLAESAGYYDEQLDALEDWDLWVRMLNLTEFKHIGGHTAIVLSYPAGSQLTSTHQQGFAWAAFNSLLKNQHLFLDDQHILRHYRDKIEEALDFLVAKLASLLPLSEAEQELGLRSQFYRRPLSVVIERIAALSEKYQASLSSEMQAKLLLLKGIAYLILKDVDSAQKALNVALTFDPQNEALLGLAAIYSAM